MWLTRRHMVDQFTIASTHWSFLSKIPIKQNISSFLELTAMLDGNVSVSLVSSNKCWTLWMTRLVDGLAFIHLSCSRQSPAAARLSDMLTHWLITTALSTMTSRRVHVYRPRTALARGRDCSVLSTLPFLCLIGWQTTHNTHTAFTISWYTLCSTTLDTECLTLCNMTAV